MQESRKEKPQQCS